MRCSVELVPRTCFYSNLRSILPAEEWDVLRKQTYAKAGYRCEICGKTGSRHPVECHEIWDYDDDVDVQRLKGLIALCPACHEVKHIGLAQMRGNGERACRHLMKLNGWTRRKTEAYLDQVSEEWALRSQREWTQDLSWLTEKIRG